MLFPCAACQNLTGLQSPQRNIILPSYSKDIHIHYVDLRHFFFLGYLSQDMELEPIFVPSDNLPPNINQTSIITQEKNSCSNHPVNPYESHHTNSGDQVAPCGEGEGLVSRTPPACALTTPAGAWVEPRDVTPVHQSLEGREYYL